MVVLAAGVGLYRLWVGIAVLGLELILMGVALGVGAPTTTEPDDEGV